MAFTSSLLASTKPTLLSPRQEAKGRDAVYVAAVPLRAPRGPAHLIASTAYFLGAWDLQHFLVIIKPNSPHLQALIYDFQPQDPENFYVAFSALSRGQVAVFEKVELEGRSLKCHIPSPLVINSGIVLKRSLKRIPRIRHWFVGFSNVNSIEVANKFNEGWSTQLVVGKHDCRHYTNELVQQLTGEHNVLEHLRSIFSGW